ncbi:MAG: 4-hydroxy-3-methylbut-2-enyl diphosphate reductase [Candidatus Marinimicrobia bacterium]|jgi:4-hydroxy-3-methylbut-2-enyl diphosphate reductase|nr:4-hydroxy-3-methylbut-2-enyl diphosphate reductase [Candidatus Neomarinimicrobiota bacterium]MBT3495689.1 4-hydroxy-3-methylbut-2-enyl diphosphate reductase [Candidatus Neomarinimicrobiota bacterium]MBT3693118.1 4-hydroxy-3-methylbut-2-enyl diphosphate reductase [Candidatus Neomarinimicrobiota bacterium]MBT3731555.1 4-hydroxy-3-methylbut-2-enyl diphosphate reductase [Candidatus Neomarinimicrobiota bacterium]MBT4144007.1 4-hydroxy-3-methylbut-2-enyl diphosphate reductase [Candidatus Neomarini
MKIILAKDAGYCFGVREAVKVAYRESENHGEVYMLGHIVHNETVVEDLEKVGAKVVETLEQVPKDRPVLFRAHGTTPEIWSKADEEKLNIVDATCPLVTEIHEEIKQLEKEGRQTIIIGDHGHDEVIGIAAQVDYPIIISNIEEAKELKKMKSAGVVTQSTQMIENVQDIIKVLMTKVFDLRFVNTICYPTRRNHEQIKALAEKCDLMIVIGSFTSANSKRLTQLALERNSKSYQVTCAKDLNIDWFKEVEVVGISAGASTPDSIITSVTEKIRKIGNINKEEVLYD